MALLVLFTAAVRAGDREEIQELVTGYVMALLRDDGAWIAAHASRRSLAPYEAQRLAALYASADQIFVPPRDNRCYTAADALVILLLRAEFDREALATMSASDVFTFLLPGLNRWGEGWVNKDSDLAAFRAEMDANGEAIIGRDLGVRVIGDHAALWADGEAGHGILGDIFFRGSPFEVWEKEGDRGWRVDITGNLFVMNYVLTHFPQYHDLSRAEFQDHILGVLKDVDAERAKTLLEPLDSLPEGSALPCPYGALEEILTLRRTVFQGAGKPEQ